MTTKTIHSDSCEQDRHPVLHLRGINLECCRNPNIESCKTVVPYVLSRDGTTIYKDGEICDDFDDDDDTPAPDASTPAPASACADRTDVFTITIGSS